jgi:hypothetical protein
MMQNDLVLVLDVSSPMTGPTERLGHFASGIMRALFVFITLISGAVSGHAEILPHPAGCPRIAFCGCGASVRVFGHPVRDLWLAANWFRFPRADPDAGMVAVRRHHVFVLERHIGGSIWLVYDANSGGRATRLHPRSIAGYVIVDAHRIAISHR